MQVWPTYIVHNINIPKARRDLFILAPSLNLAPLVPVAEPFSDPAKSIMDSLATFTSEDNPVQRPFCLINT